MEGAEFPSDMSFREVVEHDLVDEYALMIEPILLGGGKRVFPDDGRARPLEFVSTATAATGVLICAYRPESPASARRAPTPN